MSAGAVDWLNSQQDHMDKAAFQQETCGQLKGTTHFLMVLEEALNA